MSEELNKKLAERRGLKVVTENTPTGSPEMWQQKGIELYSNLGWIDFTQSLDACFKWLWDKATQTLADTDRSSIEEAIHKLFYLWATEWVVMLNDNPALALCKAIEKLIDGEK